MRIMLDANVLISALLFPGAKMDAMMNCIFTQHQLVLAGDNVSGRVYGRISISYSPGQWLQGQKMPSKKISKKGARKQVIIKFSALFILLVMTG